MPPFPGAVGPGGVLGEGGEVDGVHALQVDAPARRLRRRGAAAGPGPPASGPIPQRNGVGRGRNVWVGGKFSQKKRGDSSPMQGVS